MSSLIPMQFEGAAIRVVEIDGEPWFVGKDVAEALGYADSTTAVRSHCRGVQKLHPIADALGRTQNARILNEPDVLRLIVNSTLPAAERFERWVFEEVLPTIRRTGSYGLGHQRRRRERATIGLREVATEFKGGLLIAKLAGLKGNQAALGAAKAVTKLYGLDPLALVDATHLVADVQVRHFTPTELGKKYGESAQAFNRRLEAAGLQIRNTAREWTPTPKGEPFAVLLDTGKAHSNGTPVQQLRWIESVVDALTAPAA